RRVKALGLGLLLEEGSDLGKAQTKLICQAQEVVEVSALDALKDASQLFCANLFKRVDGEGKDVGQVVPDWSEGSLYDRLDVLVRGKVKFDRARLFALQWSDIGDVWHRTDDYLQMR